MSPPPLVLDTNVAFYARLDDIKRLHARGLVLRVADIALREAWARSVREFQRGAPAEDTRDKFFKRAARIAQFLDPRTPVAAGAGALALRIIADADCAACDAETLDYHRQIVELWEKVVGPDMSESEWIANGEISEEYLQDLDKGLFDLAQREEQLRMKQPPEDVDPATLPDQYERWDALSDAERLDLVRQYVRITLKLSDAAAERLDAYVRATALRLHSAALGARMPKKNDGADLSLITHLGEGCVLVTNETHLVKIVDDAGTFQAAWIRRLNDLEDLPDGPPWGARARATGKEFNRRD